MSLPAQHAAHVSEEEKDPTSKQFDDDEWIRSSTEAQEVITDVPEDSVMYELQDSDPKKARPIQMEEFLRKYVSRRLLALSEGEIAALTPKHTAGAAWKHRNQFYVEQERLLPLPNDRGAEQVDVPLECSLALGMVAAATRMCIAVE